MRRAVEAFLDATFNEPPTARSPAVRYAVRGPAHRWRTIVAVASGRIFRDDALALVLPSACGVELAHAASLVLDDQPSMDDAKVRRGKPCTHHAFPSWVVDMAPVFLVTLAYRASLDNPARASSLRPTVRRRWRAGARPGVPGAGPGAFRAARARSGLAAHARHRGDWATS
ncbi:MAG: polyprenyl synthetase family protein [Methyloceanibacter sp.]